MTKTIGIINKYYPPYLSATGAQINHLAHFLAAQGFKIVVFTHKGDYATSVKSRDMPTGNLVYSHSLYRGKNRIVRLLASFIESLHLVYRAHRKKCDFTFVLTDPPFLNFWTSLFFRNRLWALWCMDVYPDAFLASGLVNEKNPVLRLYTGIVKKFPPSFFISLGKNQSAFLRSKYYPGVPDVSVPVGLFLEKAMPNLSLERVSKKFPSGRIVFGYFANLGEAHDPDFLISFARKVDPSRHHLLVSCYGKHAAFIEKSLSNLDGVTIIQDMIEHHSEIDVELVSLRSSWTHISIPSKALAAMERRHPVLFLGSEESDTWVYIKSCGWRISNVNEINSFLENLTHDHIAEKARFCEVCTTDLRSYKKEAFERIKEEIENLVDE